MNHLILTKLIDNRIDNLKYLIYTYKYRIENNINTENDTKLKEESEKELNILQKQRQIIFDNYLLFDIKN